MPLLQLHACAQVENVDVESVADDALAVRDDCPFNLLAQRATTLLRARFVLTTPPSAVTRAALALPIYSPSKWQEL